jgi:HK97 family phage portal protein
MKYTPFWAGVRVITSTLSALPFIVYRRLDGDNRERVSDHRVARLMRSRVNEYVDPVTFIETRQAHALTYGNGYAEIQRDGAGRPVALWPLLPNKTTRKVTDAGVPYYEVRVEPGVVVELPDYNVLHIKGLGFDGYTGYNVVQYHKEAIGAGIAVREYGSRFFAGDGTPSGVLEHPGNLTSPAADRLKASWQKGRENSQRATPQDRVDGARDV